MTPFSQLSDAALSGKPVIVAGIQCGTSQDGLDIGIFECSHTDERLTLKLLHGAVVPLSPGLKRKASELCFNSRAPVRDVLTFDRELAEFTAEVFLTELSAARLSPGDVAAIGSHGLTLYHKGKSGANSHSYSAQVTDPDILAEKTGIPVVSGFRQRHIAAGGEGAPLAPILDYLCYRSETEPRVFLNLGGMANFSYMKPGSELWEVVSSDTGPGNRILNEWVQVGCNLPYDDGGQIAAKGTIHEDWLDAMLSESWFSLPGPKSTGPELFSLDWAEKIREKGGWVLSTEDGAATLTELTARSVADALSKLFAGNMPYRLYGSGGGMQNPYLCSRIEKLTGKNLNLIEQLGGSSDFKEAQLFACLAWVSLFTGGLKIFDSAGHLIPGKISYPSVPNSKEKQG